MVRARARATDRRATTRAPDIGCHQKEITTSRTTGTGFLRVLRGQHLRHVWSLSAVVCPDWSARFLPEARTFLGVSWHGGHGGPSQAGSDQSGRDDEYEQERSQGGRAGGDPEAQGRQRKPTPPTRLASSSTCARGRSRGGGPPGGDRRIGPRWRQVAAMVPGRSEAMCRNRYQRIMAPVKEGSNCTSRNRCTRCGQMKRGHTCRAQTTIDVPSMPSPLVFDSLGLNRDIERLESPPEPSVSPVPLGAHPGRMTMALAAGAIAPTDDIVMDLLLPQDLDELEQARSTARARLPPPSAATSAPPPLSSSRSPPHLRLRARWPRRRSRRSSSSNWRRRCARRRGRRS